MSTLQVGTISEKVTDAGVAVDGVTLKDGGATFTSDVTIGDGSASDKKILFNGNAQDFHIGLDDSLDGLTVGLGSALATNTHMLIDADGHINKPLQSAFMAKLSSNQTNINNNSAHQDIQFANEIFDQNADYNTSNYTFTAPKTGRYQLNVQVYLEAIDTSADFFYVTLLCSNNSAFFIVDPNFSADLSYYHVGGSVLMDMDAGDTAKLTYVQASGTAQTDVNTNSYFSGFLAC